MRFSLGKIIALCVLRRWLFHWQRVEQLSRELPMGAVRRFVNVWAWDNNLKANAKVFMKKNLTLSSNLPMPVVVKMNTKL